MLPKKRPLTKWSLVVRRNSCPMSSTTSDKVWQVIGRTLVCVSIHLECWLDKPRVEIVTWAAVWTWSMWIQFAFDTHWWMCIQFAFKQNQCENALNYSLSSCWYQLPSLSAFYKWHKLISNITLLIHKMKTIGKVLYSMADTSSAKT